MLQSLFVTIPCASIHFIFSYRLTSGRFPKKEYVLMRKAKPLIRVLKPRSTPSTSC